MSDDRRGYRASSRAGNSHSQLCNCTSKRAPARTGTLLNSGKPEFSWRIHDVQLHIGE
jgi:hypothetical protein